MFKLQFEGTFEDIEKLKQMFSTSCNPLNVKITNPIDNQTLVYDSASQHFVNQTVTPIQLIEDTTSPGSNEASIIYSGLPSTAVLKIISAPDNAVSISSASGKVNVELSNKLKSLNTLSPSGFAVFRSASGTYVSREFVVGELLRITNADGATDNPVITHTYLGFFRYKSGSQSISPSTNTTITGWSTASSYGEYDNTNSFDESTGIFTVPTGSSGCYDISASVAVDNTGSVKRHIFISINDANVGPGNALPAITPSGGSFGTINYSAKLNEGDTVRLKIFHTNASDINVIDNVDSRIIPTFFSVRYRGEN